MLVFPNAKINIGLYVTEKRDDGYHNIESVFVPIPLNDVLEITGTAQDWTIFSSGLVVEGDVQSNLCIKAARLFAQEFQVPPSAIHLHKVIPMGAGLGGGSSDAAFTLKCLARLHSIEVSNEKLEEMAMKIGSDCGFFIRNIPQFVQGRGEKMEPISFDLKGCWLALIHPGIHVSTAGAYSLIKPAPAPIDLRQEITKPIESWRSTIENQFERSVFEKHPQIRELKEAFYNKGALYASMSGSGSAVFGIFRSKPDLSKDFKDSFYLEIQL